MARAVGTVVGAAVGDALGAPFEFGPAGAFSAKYPPGLDPADVFERFRRWAADEPKNIGLQT